MFLKFVYVLDVKYYNRFLLYLHFDANMNEQLSVYYLVV